ncbi:MAG TPA: glycogen debranching N-terminal domain-containing protein, partial [Actinomycetota bacterium]|nr:glycogen debranching N-terminal domain-containing protein [Actinomycetota bacterium]
MALTILEGSTFCVSDERGDIEGPTDGLFASDTRFLSRWILTLNGARPHVLSFDKVEYFSAAYYLRNPVAGGLDRDELSIARERFVGEGMQDHVVVQNHAHRRLDFELALEVGTDFADILTVKEHDFALGDPDHANPLPERVTIADADADGHLVLVDPSPFAGVTQLFFSQRGKVDGSTVRYPIALEPGESWGLRVEVTVASDGSRTEPENAERQFGDELARVRASLSAWHMRIPQLRATWEPLAAAFDRSVSDLASLRIRSAQPEGQLFAAGMPWFMAVFGRDTLITCLQTFLFGPELARNALAVLAELQATEDDPEPDAEPGRSSTRSG